MRYNLFLTPRDAVAYIMDTFPIVRRNGQICIGDGKPDKECIVPWREYDADHVIPHSRGDQTSIARQRHAGHPGNFDSSKWGQVATCLKVSGFITDQQEAGLTGVFSFASPGSHTPVGFSEQEFARLGRSLALGICYFLTKHFNASHQ